jgi:hypothetical protein
VTLRLGHILPFGGIIAILLLYSGYWFYAKGQIENQLERWVAQQEAAGYTVDHTAFSIDGFPYRFRIEIDAPTLQAPASDGGWTISMANVSAHALPYDFSHWIVELVGPLDLADVNNTHSLQITADRALISLVSNSAGETIRIGGEFDAMTLTPLSGQALDIRSISHLNIAGIIDDGDVLRTRLEASGVEIGTETLDPATSREFGPIADLIRIDASATHWTSLARGGDVASWSQAGGSVQIADVNLDWGPAQINSGEGSVAFDTNARPNGRLSLKISDPRTLVEALVASGQVPEEAGPVLQLLLMVNNRNSDGTPLTVIVRDCLVFVGPFPIGSMCGAVPLN